MAPSEQYKRSLMPSLKKTVTIVTTAGFFAAAFFLAAGLWLPANAAPATTATDEPSLLLALDTPNRPVPKLRLPDVSARADEEGDTVATIVNQDLATELNNWTYTLSTFANIINGYDSLIKNFFSLQITLVRNEMFFWTGVLQNVGLNDLAQQYVAALNDITLALNALFATGAPVSPHS
jgi:hypothetical protein